MDSKIPEMDNASVNIVMKENPAKPSPVFNGVSLFKKRWTYHVLFWIIYYSCYAYFILYTTYQIHDPVFYFQILLFYPFDILLVYFNIYVLIPRLLKSKKYLYYGIVVFISIFIAGCADVLIKKMYAHFGSALMALTADFNVANLSGAMAARFYLLGLTTGIKLARLGGKPAAAEGKRENVPGNGIKFLKNTDKSTFLFQYAEQPVLTGTEKIRSDA